MSLREYRRKRDFHKTAEPSGGERDNRSRRESAKTAKNQLRFVIQEHAASRLHFDFRLELDGVLKSWAVPKGPSLDPAVKSLAVEVEDHPLDYASFEGTIPQGEYGGGTVMVWDQGEWEPQGDPRRSLREGRLKFELHGEKLAGVWNLVRMHGRGDKNWLLIKHGDDAAKSGDVHRIVKRKPKSVLSGRTMRQIEKASDRVWTKNGEQAAIGKATPRKKAVGKNTVGTKLGTPAPFPEDFSPQLATASSKVPEGDDWVHEVKFDGYRILCEINDSNVRLISRNRKDWTKRFSAVAAAVKDLDLKNSIIDGELIAVDASGVSSFQKLQQSLKIGKPEDLLYYAFDLPYLEGRDLRSMPLVDRKALLAELLHSHAPNDGVIRYSDHFEGSGAEVLSKACEHQLEGIISKRRDSTYENHRSRTWLKSKCQGREEFVIGGFTKPHGARVGFGALLLGRYDADGKLKYCGRVGTGFDNNLLRDLKRRLTALLTDEPPFQNPPIGSEAKEVRWVRPKLVGEVEFTEETEDGMLRHPSFQGLREDKSATDVRREDAPAAELTTLDRGKKPKNQTDNTATYAGVTLTHPDRILYPDDGITKRQLAEYYTEIADWVLPYVVDRPLTLVRCPGGAGGKCFYQKHRTDSMPDAIDSIPIREKSETADYVVIHDLAGLISLVQMSVLELHPWSSRIDRVEQPDQVIFDLDPGPEVEWKEVVQAARDVRTLLQDLGLESFVRTSGGKGLHIVAPLFRRNGWEEVVEFARNIAAGLAAKESDRFVANMRKSLRHKKIYIDYLRNQRGATAIANYSTRNRPGAPVAMPMDWDDLNLLTGGNSFSIRNSPARLASLRGYPWAGFHSRRQSLTQKIQEAARKYAIATRNE